MLYISAEPRFLFRWTKGFFSFFFISNIQESIIKTDVLASFCTDHSPIFFSLQLKDMPTQGKGFWKFNSSLSSNDDYVEKMKNQISETILMLRVATSPGKSRNWF